MSADPPLTVAIEGRSSARDYAGGPVSTAALGELLYRAARVRSLITIPVAEGTAPDGGEEPQLSDRPYPGGGACYELELYVLISQCAGLPAGTYHYDPLGHRLEPVSADPASVESLRRCARTAVGADDSPPVLLTIAARFRRLSWKYEGVAYSLALMDVGVLIQTLYLVCTGMGLAPCAIGSVQADAAARAFGTDWRIEPSIAQFAVGSDPRTPGKPPGRRPANDADWHDRARALLPADSDTTNS